MAPVRSSSLPPNETRSLSTTSSSRGRSTANPIGSGLSRQSSLIESTTTDINGSTEHQQQQQRSRNERRGRSPSLHRRSFSDVRRSSSLSLDNNRDGTTTTTTTSTTLKRTDSISSLISVGSAGSNVVEPTWFR